jgi:hypothetical protein
MAERAASTRPRFGGGLRRAGARPREVRLAGRLLRVGITPSGSTPASRPLRVATPAARIKRR